MKNIFLVVVIVIAALFTSCAKNELKDCHLKLWYDKPADATIPDKPVEPLLPDRSNRFTIDEEWLKALPLGNGALGAMVFGDVNKERIQLCEESMWSGCPNDNDNPKAHESLQEIRQLLFEDKLTEAEELIKKTQICKGVGSGEGRGADDPFGSFQTLGDLWIDNGRTAEYDNYYRELDMNDAVVRVTYTQGGVKYKREIFISRPDQVMVARFTADKPGQISFSCKMTRPERFKTYSGHNQLIMTGALDNGYGGDGLEYMARLKAINKNGKVSYSNSDLKVENADEVILFLSASTSYLMTPPKYNGRDYQNLTNQNLLNAVKKDYNDLLLTHKKEYQQYFSRVDLKLTSNNREEIPTDERIKKFKKNQLDSHLVELVFQYGRYLLISSSRPNTLPANLQGIWANQTQTPWNGDYHPDINFQMNYWPAEVTNLSEMHLPYFDYLASLVEPGKKTAKVQYGLDGWVTHTICNVWGYTSPGERPSWGLHITASGWMCQHIMEHYLFTGDKEFLKKMYPVLKEASRFYLGWLVKDSKTGRLVSGPSISPENTFIAPDGNKTQFTMGCAHDQQVIWQLFKDFLTASEVLGISSDITRQVFNAKNELASGFKIGSDGRLMEWTKEYKELYPNRGHISHLFAMHPAAQINEEKTPELANAAYKSLIARQGEATGRAGWAGAWFMHQFARHKDKKRAVGNLVSIIRTGLHPNLFTTRPFQIDADLGTTSGIAEMLVQSHTGVIDILPCLPDEFPNGKVRGLMARGGHEVDISWHDGKMTEVKIKSKLGNPCKVRYGDKIVECKVEKGGCILLDSSLIEK